MKTAIVILNWNTKDFLKTFLPTLLSSVNKIEGAEVIVADNASSDGSLDLMREVFPEVRTIVLDKNYGFTGGYNRALREIDADYYVLINSDIEVSENWLEPLIDWMEKHPECGACAPKLRSWHKRELFEYAGAAGGFIDKFGYPFCRGRVMSRIEEDKAQYDHAANEVFWASGACLMLRSGLYHELGGLDERFFAHMEEIDLCWRMQLAGYTVCVVPESIVYHVGGGTLPASSPFKLFLNYRNNLLMLNNNLAKSIGLEYISRGMDIYSAAAKALDKAERRIWTRMNLDGLSAIVYLLTFRFKAFAAVWKAHREFAKLRKNIKRDELVDFLENNEAIDIHGVYNKSIILQSFIQRDKIFEYIKNTDFIKFKQK